MDALRDLDDPFTLTHLFATLPAEGRYDIHRDAVATSRRLATEWQAYVVRTHALRRVFVSVKGFYYQVRGGPGVPGVWGQAVGRGLGEWVAAWGCCTCAWRGACLCVVAGCSSGQLCEGTGLGGACVGWGCDMCVRF